MTEMHGDERGFLSRLVARLTGEVSAETLDGYRRAGLGVYELLADAEAQRREIVGASDVDHATRCFLLCSWNAFALQTLGDAFVEADYAADPRTVGFIPPVTREQALRFYGEVEAWMGYAHEAQVNAGYRLPLALPAELPAFAETDPCPREHLEAMLTATDRLRGHAEAAIVDAERLPGTANDQLSQLHGVLASATNAATYARRLYGAGRVAQTLHERIESSVKDALASFYLAGQLAAMPDLLGRRPTPVGVTGAGQRLPGPDDPRFDRWCLTDPHTREQWKQVREAREAINLLWEYDPNPRATLDLKSEIDAALAAGHITYATDRDGRRLGSYYCCPWSAVYVTTRPLIIGQRRLRSGQQFTMDVSAEEIAVGGVFKRELLLGNFSPTDMIDYCDPREGRHHDD